MVFPSNRFFKYLYLLPWKCFYKLLESKKPENDTIAYDISNDYLWLYFFESASALKDKPSKPLYSVKAIDFEKEKFQVKNWNEKDSKFQKTENISFQRIFQFTPHIHVFKYGNKYTETGVIKYLLKYCVHYYWFENALTKSKRWILGRFFVKQPDSLKYKNLILDCLAEQRFMPTRLGSSLNAYISIEAVLKVVFGRNIRFSSGYLDRYYQFEYLLEGLVNLDLAERQGEKKYRISVKGLEYLESLYRDEERHRDSKNLQIIGIIVATFVAWEDLYDFFSYISTILAVTQ